MSDRYAIRSEITLAAGAVVLVAFAVVQQLAGATAGEYLALGLILVAGFPHGADDVTVIRRLLGERGRRTAAVYTAAYLAVVGATLLLWYVAPALGLASFLAISVFHFGGDHGSHLGLRGGAKSLYAGVWGSFVLLAPLCWHPGELAPVLAEMLAREVPAGYLSLAGHAASAAFGATVALALAHYSRTGAREWLGEVGLAAVLAYAFVALPSLWGFAFFFACVHAVTSVLNQLHWARQAPTPAALAAFLRRSAPYALLSVVAVVGLLGFRESAALTPGWYAGFFVLVSALTTPHALVVHRAARAFEAPASFSATNAPVGSTGGA